MGKNHVNLGLIKKGNPVLSATEMLTMFKFYLLLEQLSGIQMYIYLCKITN